VSKDQVPQPRWEVSGVREDEADGAERIVRDFHDLYCHSRDRTWANTRWFGVPVIKCPFDLWAYQELLFQLKPDVILETGTHMGGSAYFMASMCDMIGRGRIITVDIGDAPDRPTHPRINYMIGSSTDPEMVTHVNEAIAEGGGETVMVVLDSNHHRDHVMEEMRLYSPLVSPGSYMIVEDTNINSWRPEDRRRPGPLEAVHDFLAQDDRFEIDRSWEKFFVTFNPSGFLRRRDEA
jgi:cephalosporin hydroxylase